MHIGENENGTSYWLNYLGQLVLHPKGSDEYFIFTKEEVSAMLEYVIEAKRVREIEED